MSNKVRLVLGPKQLRDLREALSEAFDAQYGETPAAEARSERIRKLSVALEAQVFDHDRRTLAQARELIYSDDTMKCPHCGKKIPAERPRGRPKKLDDAKALALKERGWSLAEIAAKLGVTRSGVQGAIRRAKSSAT